MVHTPQKQLLHFPTNKELLLSLNFCLSHSAQHKPNLQVIPIVTMPLSLINHSCVSVNFVPWGIFGPSGMSIPKNRFIVLSWGVKMGFDCVTGTILRGS